MMAHAELKAPPIATPATLRRLRGLLITVIAVVLLMVLVPVVLIAIGVTLDAGPWRGLVAQAVGRALHREVAFDGPAHISISLKPELLVAGARILNPPGYSERDLATLGNVIVRLDLWPLLRQEVRVLEVSASDVRVRLQVLADGSHNWRFGEHLAAPGPSASTATAPSSWRNGIEGVGVERIHFERIALEFVRAGGTPHFFNLDTLDARAPKGQALHVTLQGRVERSFPYSVTLDGGSVSAYLAAREPWPLKLELAFAGTRLDLEGHLSTALGRGHGDAVFTLRTDDLSQVERLLQVSLPPLGATRLAARVRWQPGRWEMQQIDGQSGQTAVQGDLALSTAGQVPRLTGALTLPVLDLGPFLGQAPASREAPRSLLDIYRELQAQTFDLKRLGLLDADLRISVGKWLSLPGDVHDVSLAVRLQEGVLQSPVEGWVAAVPLRGRLDLDSRAVPPAFALALSAADSPLGGLAELFADVDGVEGNVERFDFGLAARGRTLNELMESLDLAVSLDNGRLSYGNGKGRRSVEFRLDRFEVVLPAGAALRGSVHGALLGEAFSARFSGGNLPTLAGAGRWPVTVSAKASGAQLGVSGSVVANGAGSSADLRLAFDADRVGSVARWLGLAADAQAPLHFAGRLQVARDAVWLRGFSVALGRTRVGGDVGRTGLSGRKPLTFARLEIEDVDVAQLQSMRPPPKAVSDATAAADSAAMLDVPLLPSGFSLIDTDFELRLHRLLLPTTEFTDIRFDGHVRDGRMPDAPFSAVVAGTPFSGTAAVDLRGASPEVALQLAAAGVDIGDLLRRLKVAEGIDAQVDTVRLALVLRGSRLADMLERSELKAELGGGQWTVRNPANKPLVTIAVAQGRIEAPVGAPLQLAVDGAIDDTPVAIRLSSGRMAELARVGSRVPFKLSAQAAQARLDIDGSVRLPLKHLDGDLELRLAGRRLDTLNRLAHVDLPPWGPWSLGGKLVVSDRDYSVPDLHLRVGDSRLDGHGTLGFSGPRPRLEAALSAPSIQLDDFRFEDWSPVAAKPPQPKERLDADAVRARARAAAQQGQRLLSRATLLKQDVELDVQVAHVLSGTDRLGDGRLHVRLNEARLEVAPIEVRLPSGAATLRLGYEPSPDDHDARVNAQLRVDRFDYAVLARRVQRTSDLRGEFSVHMDLGATAPLEELMQRGSGKLDIAVWPQNLKAGVFDLWAVNLFVALVPALDGSATSKVNCAVARFDLKDGRLTHNALLVDTTRIRVGGTAQVDFRDETVAAHLQPRPKQPQFFSLATPVEVQGHITNPRVELAQGSVLATIGRFVASIVTTPFEMLTSTPPPADGADVCDAAIAADR